MKLSHALLSAAAAAALATSSAASAAWTLAESEHFRVYSTDSEDATKAYVAELERVDQALSIVSGKKPAAGAKRYPESGKVTVFRFGEPSDIAALVGAPGSGIAGFFIPRAGQSVAFVPRRNDNARGLGARRSGFELDPKPILFHEYTHYYMFQHGSAAYPAWYVEGFAELLSTLQIEGDRFTIGEPPKARGFELGGSDIELKRLLDPPAKPERRDGYRNYSIGWLLTSHLTFAPHRSGQLGKFLALFNGGVKPLDAATQAFGDLDVLEKELDTYRRSPARLLKVPFGNMAAPQVTVRTLGEDEEAIMDIVLKSERGVRKEEALKQVPQARALLAKYPASVPVMLAATEVEFDAGNYAEAEAIAGKALAADPANVTAAIYLAEVAMERAQDDPAQYAEARERYVAANRIDSEHPLPLAGYYRTFLFAGEAIPDTAAASLEGAFSHAPFDQDIRAATAHMLLVEGRDADARVVMAPLINGAHVRGADKIRELVTKFDAGERQPLIDHLAPKTRKAQEAAAEAAKKEAEEKAKKK